MATGNWLNNDGLYLQFGTAKATVERAGEFQSPGIPNRIVEARINLADFTTLTGNIISNTEFFPAGQNIYIESVEVITEAALGTTTGTINVGLIQDDRVTVPTVGGATAFVAGISTTGIVNPGSKVTLVGGSAYAGGLVGNYLTQWNTNAITSGGVNSTGGYLTLGFGTASSTGIIVVRIMYHGDGTISY